MKAVKNTPKPTQPPSTIDITGLTERQAKAVAYCLSKNGEYADADLRTYDVLCHIKLAIGIQAYSEFVREQDKKARSLGMSPYTHTLSLNPFI